MKYCIQCGNQINDDVKFCTACGAQNPVAGSDVSQNTSCPQCGTDINGKNFCTNCGYRMQDTSVQTSIQPTSQAVNTPVNNNINANAHPEFVNNNNYNNNTIPKKPKNNKKIFILIIVIVALFLFMAVGSVVFFIFVRPMIATGISYNKAVELMENQEYYEAASAFSELEDYKDSEQLSENCSVYAEALDAMNNEQYDDAEELFHEINGFADADEKAQECYNLFLESKYNEANTYFNNNDYEKALELFSELGDYNDSAYKAEACVTNIELAQQQGDTSSEMVQEEYNEKFVVANLGKSLESIYNNMGYPDSISQESWGLDGGSYYLSYNYSGVSYGVQHEGTLPGGIVPSIEAVTAWTSDDTIVNVAYITGSGKFNGEIMCGLDYSDLSEIGYLDLTEVKPVYHDSAYGAYGELSYNSKTYNLMFVFNSKSDLTVKAIRVFLNDNNGGFIEEYTSATVKLKDGYLNVRKQPNGDIIGKLYNGDSVNAIYDDGKWTLIKYGSSYGYVASEYLRY